MSVEVLASAAARSDETVIGGDGPIVVPDPSLLFGAEFLRDGPDLVLRNAGAADIRIVDYFRSEVPADLQDANGSTLRGHVVERLAGPEAPGQYAQAGQQGREVPIGQVETVEGTASVQRSDGTTEQLSQSSRIFMGDVVQTAGESTLSITFVDGTIFTLSAGSRMVIDELIYSPDGNGNSAVFNLVEGGFIFIAGQVAGTGGMEVNTPAATMGIRGTTVLADVRTQNGVSTVEVTLTRDPDGGIGRVELIDLGGNLITTITGIDTKWIVSTEEGLTREVDRTAEDEAADNVLIAEAVAAYEAAATRFGRDGSYIRLDALSPGDGDGLADDDGPGGDDIDLDSEDAEGIEPPPPAPEPETPDDGTFDEGSLQPGQQPEAVFDVFRTALEDAEDGPVAGQLSVEANLSGTFTLVSATTNGTVSLAKDGGYSYTPNTDFNGTDQFTYSVIGADGVSRQGKVTISVSPVNDAPVITSAGASPDPVVFEDVSPNVSDKLVAKDPDQGDVLTWSGSAAGIYGSLTVASNGAWTYTLGPAANSLAAGQEATDIFTATVTDAQGASDTADIVITITGANDAPVAATLVFSSTGGGTIDAALSATDPDAGEVLTFSQGASGPANGTLTLEADGSFAYVPDAGFAGFDGFDFVVTDANGATSTAHAILSVASGSVDVPGGGQVSVSVLPDPDIGPAGQIVATSSAPETQHLNLVFVLDASGSVGTAGWQTQVNSVADALEALAAEFADTATQIDVNVISFASTAQSAGVFDLSDPNLASTVRDLPFTGGGTNWKRALERVESFLDGEPTGELNYVYFTSDGFPSENEWPVVAARLTDAETKGYTVDIEAFGIGSGADLDRLSLLDPDPTLLDGPEDLLAAIEATPLFGAELVDLSVRLIADGVDLGEVADESAPGIDADGVETTLALADIAGLAELLGDNNLISVTAGFDLDGDKSTSEIELFTSQVFTKQGLAVSLNGTDESDLLLGSDFADVLAGNGGNDILLGFGGDDLISTGPGLDHVRAGAGNDRIVLESAEAPSAGFASLVDGGAGRDVLEVTFGGDLNTDVLPLVDLSGIEALELDNGAANSLELTLEDILGFSDEADTELEALLGAALPESLTIHGDNADTVTLANGATGSFVDTGHSVTDDAGNTLDIYTYVDGGHVLATLAVDSDVAVATAPAGG